MYSSKPLRVCSLDLKRTGCPTLFAENCPIDCHSLHYYILDPEDDDVATLLLTARVNVARSQTRPSALSLVHIDQTFLFPERRLQTDESCPIPWAPDASFRDRQ